MVIPMGPIFLDASRDTPEVPGSYLEQMMSWREAARLEAVRTARLNLEVTRVPKYIDWIQGQQWDLRRARYRSRIYDNRIDTARTDMISLLTSGKPTIAVTTTDNAFDEQADIAQKIIQAEWQRGSMDLQMATVIDLNLLWGTSFWKIGAAMPGMMRAIPCGPDNVLPIQPGWHLQESTAVLYRTWKPVSWYKRVYPMRAAGIEREAQSYDVRTASPWQKPSNIDEYTWNSMSPQMRRLMGTRVAPQEIPSRGMYQAVELQEFYIDDQSINQTNRRVLMKDPYLPINQHNYWYWVDPGQRLYPRKRLVVFGGRRLLYDGPSPYWHGLYPFACMRLDPVPWSFWGKSYYRNLMPLNMAINETAAGVMDMIKRALNPVAITKEGAVPLPAWKEFFTDMPGAKLRMGPMGNPSSDIRYMEEPPIPPWVFSFLQQYLIPEFDRLSGLVDPIQLASKNQAPGGDTIQAMRDSFQTAIQLKGRRIEDFLRDAGTQCLSNVFQFYTAKQRMMFLGADGITLQDFNYSPDALMPNSANERESHWRNFSLTVIPGSLHSGAKDRDKQTAMALYKAQAISREKLLETLEINDPEGIARQIYQEVAQMKAAMAPAPPEQAMSGEGAIPPEVLQMLQQMQAGGGGTPAPGGGAGGPTPAGAPPGETERMTRGQRNGQMV